MANKLLEAMDELILKEKLKKKKKPVFNVVKEKRLQYYSGWSSSDRAVDKEKVERQKKL